MLSLVYYNSVKEMPKTLKFTFCMATSIEVELLHAFSHVQNEIHVLLNFFPLISPTCMVLK